MTPGCFLELTPGSSLELITGCSFELTPLSWLWPGCSLELTPDDRQLSVGLVESSSLSSVKPSCISQASDEPLRLGHPPDGAQKGEPRRLRILRSVSEISADKKIGLAPLSADMAIVHTMTSQEVAWLPLATDRSAPDADVESAVNQCSLTAMEIVHSLQSMALKVAE